MSWEAKLLETITGNKGREGSPQPVELRLLITISGKHRIILSSLGPLGIALLNVFNIYVQFIMNAGSLLAGSVSPSICLKVGWKAVYILHTEVPEGITK